MNKLGPGEYKIAENQQTKANAIKFGKEKRAISDYDPIKNDKLGPGDYNLKFVDDIGNLEKFDLHKLK